jgi:beta-lactamase class A
METENKSSNRGKLVLTATLVFLGFCAGWFSARNYHNEDDSKNTVESRQKGGYYFINPLLDCEISGESAIKKYIPFETKVKESIQENVIDKNADMAMAVYFRNLNNGPWFAINGNADFAPASLLKVPLMIAYLKLSEDNPEILSKSLNVESLEDNMLQIVKPEKSVEEGKNYTVEELLKYMIIFSDNNATKLLLENMPKDKLDNIYIDLGINISGVRNSDDIITVKDYASFFRILYNSAYLSKKNSEKALEWLSETEYKDGILKGIQNGVTVSHKFGEREIVVNRKFERQFHDCGVVYYEKYPYLLCVMTKGDDFKKLTTVIADVSKIVFDEIKADYP